MLPKTLAELPRLRTDLAMELDRFTALLAALLPGLAWLWFFRRKDDHEPEPRLLLAKMFLLGCGAALLVVWLRPRYEALVLRAGWLPENLADAYLVTALGEETVKAAALLTALLWRRDFSEPLDGMIYGIAVALGFATTENTFYVWITGDPMVLVLRTFTSTLAHVAFTGSVGLGLGLARFRTGRFRVGLLAGAFVAAVLVHGTFDWLLLGPRGSSLVALLVCLPVALAALGASLRWARHQSPHYHPELPAGSDQVAETSSVSR